VEDYSKYSSRRYEVGYKSVRKPERPNHGMELKLSDTKFLE